MRPFEIDGALYKSFKTKVEAEAVLEFSEHYFDLRNEQEGETIKQRKAKISTAIELMMESICVDTTYLGNPGNIQVSIQEQIRCFK
jgi:ribonuclease HI